MGFEIPRPTEPTRAGPPVKDSGSSAAKQLQASASESPSRALRALGTVNFQ
jgi:hypothetical protein